MGIRRLRCLLLNLGQQPDVLLRIQVLYLYFISPHSRYAYAFGSITDNRNYRGFYYSNVDGCAYAYSDKSRFVDNVVVFDSTLV